MQSFPNQVRQDEAKGKRWYGLYSQEDVEIERILARNCDEAHSLFGSKTSGNYVESVSAHAAMFD